MYNRARRIAKLEGQFGTVPGEPPLLSHFPHNFLGMFVLSVSYGPDRLFFVTTIGDRVE